MRDDARAERRHTEFRDIAPVAAITRVPNVVEVHPSLPINSVADLIAYAKANPGKLNAASGGVGATAHRSLELFKMMTATDIMHVPYRGSGPALVDLLAGQVQVMFDSMPSSVELIRSGKLRGLAVRALRRPAGPSTRRRNRRRIRGDVVVWAWRTEGDAR